MIWCYTFLSVVKSFIEESLGKYLKTVLGKAKNRYFEKKNSIVLFNYSTTEQFNTASHNFPQILKEKAELCQNSLCVRRL